MRVRIISRFFTLFLLVACFAASAQTAFDLVPSQDNSIYQDFPQNSNGAGDLFTGPNGLGAERRALLAFELGGIPAGSIVQSAELTVTLVQTNSGDVRFGLHPLEASWGEADSVGMGQGAPAQPGEATWNHRFFSTDLWQSVGGDFSSDPLTETVIGAPLTDYTFPTTPAFATRVQKWIDDPASNFGIIIVKRPDSFGTAKRLLSRESSQSPPVLRLSVLVGERLFRSGFE